jgi:hypothetical protein
MTVLKLTTALMIAAAVWPAGSYAMTEPGALVAPKPVPEAAVSPPHDLRTPDNRMTDIAMAQERYDGSYDGGASEPAQGLRSPDGRDAARDVAATPVASTAVPHGRPTPSVSDGFEWSDAGLGAAVMLVLVSAAGGAVLLAGRSQRRSPTA